MKGPIKMYIIREKEVGEENAVIPLGGGSTEIQVEGICIHLYDSDVREILKVYPNRKLVNFVRHNTKFSVVSGTIIPND